MLKGAGVPDFHTAFLFYIPKNFLTASIKGRRFREVTISRLGAFTVLLSGFFTLSRAKDPVPLFFRLFSYLIQSSYFIFMLLDLLDYNRTIVLYQDYRIFIFFASLRLVFDPHPLE